MMHDPCLGALLGMTIVTSDLDAALGAYTQYLGYRGAPPEKVGDHLAQAWGCPAAADARMATLWPESGTQRFVRFVETPTPEVAPFSTFGWSAIEIVVQDVDAVAARLVRSPFRTIGAPAVLDFDFTDKIRAMQVLGPAGEVLYLTQIEEEIPGFDLPRAESFVDAPFIAVLGGPSLEAAAAPYAAHGRAAGPVLQARIDVLSRAYRLPADTRYDLTTLALPDRTLIEIDAFPAAATPRPRSAIGLPAGVAMASFDDVGGGNIRVVSGICGELIEMRPREIQ
jgi:hypothetical protein